METNFQKTSEHSLNTCENYLPTYLDMMNPYIVHSYKKAKAVAPDFCKVGDGKRIRKELQAQGNDGIVNVKAYHQYVCQLKIKKQYPCCPHKKPDAFETFSSPA